MFGLATKDDLKCLEARVDSAHEYIYKNREKCSKKDDTLEKIEEQLKAICDHLKIKFESKEKVSTINNQYWFRYNEQVIVKKCDKCGK